MKRLVVVDGLDGCGKDTHAQRVRQLMEAEEETVVVVSHPSRRRFGMLSKKALQGSGHIPRALASLFYTMDVLGSVAQFKRTRDGTTVFVRYILGTAYLPRRLAPMGYRVFRNLLPFPDLAIFIDIDPDVALRRIEARDHMREMFETKEKLESVRRVAIALTKDEWVVIDNSQDGEGPFERLCSVLVAKGLIRGPST
jgi:dTMP kinase